VQTLRLIRWVVPHGEDRIFAAPPDALQVDLKGWTVSADERIRSLQRVYLHREIPDTLLGVESIVVLWMHDTWWDVTE
jgi:hypothetical protein